jgi:hypothetical protein
MILFTHKYVILLFIINLEFKIIVIINWIKTILLLLVFQFHLKNNNKNYKITCLTNSIRIKLNS